MASESDVLQLIRVYAKESKIKSRKFEGKASSEKVQRVGAAAENGERGARHQAKGAIDLMAALYLRRFEPVEGILSPEARRCAPPRAELNINVI